MQVTVTEAARRAQIIDATIETLADLGYPKTSFARIVERAGLSSTRLVSYHFRDKDDLMMAVLIAALGAADALLEERLAGRTDRVDLVRAYIETKVDLLRTHPQPLRAIAEVGAHHPDFAPVLHDFRVGRLQRQLMQGQREGVFGAFDAEVMARAIADSVDGARESDGAELADLFLRACT